MLRKICTICKEPKLLNQFNLDAHKKDGHRSSCRACEKENNYYRQPPRRRKVYKSRIIRYRVIYDPLNSFGENSSFTRQEIMEMLNLEYLAIGTRFRSGTHEYRVNDDLCLIREVAA